MRTFPLCRPASARDDLTMNDDDKRARMRAEAVSAELAERREERSMPRGARELEGGLKQLEDDEQLAERQIEAEWRREHHGHEPVRPPNWPARSR
jgi:hypothetical protein